MDNLITKIYLFISALIIILVGGFISITPNEYLISMNVQFGADLSGGFEKNIEPSVSLLSDLRGMGGVMFVIGLYVFMATFRKDLIKSAVIFSVIVYTSFVVFRALSFMLDGIPPLEITLAFLIEFIVAFWGLLLIFPKKNHYETKKAC